MPAVDSLWIPIVIAAAVLQTVRNAAQRDLAAVAGTLAATAARFLYGLPFAVGLFAACLWLTGESVPVLTPTFVGWAALGGLAQLAATALLLRAMAARSFVVGIALSKTEVLLVAALSLLLLAERVGLATWVAAVLTSTGVMLLSIHPRITGTDNSLASRGALLGLASGASFAVGAVAYRAGTQALPEASPWAAGTCLLVVAQSLQSLAIGTWLFRRNRAALTKLAQHWRTSLIAGVTGTAGSAGWLMAFALRAAADVVALGMIDVLFGYAVSHRFFRERVTGREALGIALLIAGIIVIVRA